MVVLPAVEMPAFEVRFMSLFQRGRGLVFPCDARGQVDLDALSERARNNYLFARAMVGRDHAAPRICPAASALDQGLFEPLPVV